MTHPPASAPRPRIIERWFPCAEVSAASGNGWGSSNSETLLMSWFAKRPLAQSRAAVLCSLLPWPEDPAEQERVQAIIREALGSCQDPDWYACRIDSCAEPDCSKKSHMSDRGPRHPHAYGIGDCARIDPTSGYNAARTDVMGLFQDAYTDRPAEMLDPFSGRGLIPLEAARYGQQAHAIDYSPVATLASRVLIDWPFRDWSQEPELTYDPPGDQVAAYDPYDPLRLARDIATVQKEVQARLEDELDQFYPSDDKGAKPWGYLWAQVIPCDGCGREFPLYGSNLLHGPHPPRYPEGVSFELAFTGAAWAVQIVSGMTNQLPTMRARDGKRGKLAWCPRRDCAHAHELKEHKRLVQANYDRVEMLVVAELDGAAKIFRASDARDLQAALAAQERLASVTVNGFPGRPDEQPLKGTDRIGAVIYGAQDFGDLSVDRQNLLHATIAKSIGDIATELLSQGCSHAYASALAGYCGASLVRKLRRSGRASFLMSYGDGRSTGASSSFTNESALGFNYDSFEVGLAPSGPGTWGSATSLPSTFDLYLRTEGRPAKVQRGSALSIPARDGAFDAVVTDPPYEMMITYSDASDIFYVWLKRALAAINSDFSITANPRGTQEKDEEIIVHKHYGSVPNEHRTPAFYNMKIAEAFQECRRVVRPDGVVSIVFGHGDPEAWRSLLDAIAKAGLVLTGAWPANTEAGGHTAGGANIQTTLTLACRTAPEDRPDGRVAEVDAETRRVIADRVKNVWGPSGLSYVDQKMAAAGPALEVVGRYERILDKKGQPVDLTRYLPLARQAVTEAHDLRFDSLPLETFDEKTRFALEWARAYGRQVQASSEARWQRLAADLEDHETEGVLADVAKGVRLITSKEARVEPIHGMPLFEVALAAAVAWRDGTLADAATAIRTAGVDPQDQHFWACINALSKSLPETDQDGTVWTSMVRNRDALAAGVANAEAAVHAARAAEERLADYDSHNPALFEDPNSLFGREGN